MARYIDAEKLLEKAEEIEWFNDSTGYYDLINIVHKYDVETAPTADVVPKSEYESLKNENIETIKTIAESHREYAREIFEKIEKDGKFAIDFVENHKSYSEEVRQAKLECYKDIQNYIAELKKKYTEENV